MTDIKLCAGCLREHDEIKAESWCCECSEPICRTCARYHKKMSPPHKIVPKQTVSSISPEFLQMSNTCSKHHQQNCTMFCSIHDQIVCHVCIFQSHRHCTPLITLEKASKNIKQSSAFADLIKRMDNMNDTLKKVVTDLDDGLLCLKKGKRKIRQKIAAFKNEVVLCLEEIENKLIKDLDKEYQECRDILQEAHSNISAKANTILTWREDIESITDISTNIHAFRALKYLDSKMHNEEEDIKEIKDKTTVPSIQFHSSSRNIKVRLSSLGKIYVVKKQLISQSEIQLHQQGQVHLRPKEREEKTKLLSSLDSRKLVFNAVIERGCFISDNRLLLVNTKDRTALILCNLDGSELRNIRVEHPANNVAMFDQDRVLIATSDGVKIVNIHGRRRQASEERVLHPGIYCWSVASLNGKVVVFMDVRVICITDISGKILNQIETSVHAYDIALDARGNIFVTECYGNCIYVITETGKESLFFEAPDLKGNIASDNDGNIYVSQTGSDDVYKVSNHNQTPEVVLSFDDDVCLPNILAYNKERNTLLLANTIDHSIQIFKL